MSLAEAGPSSIEPHTSTKRKNEDSQDIPRYRRGYLWSDAPHNSCSPSALFTETAIPLPSPPQHLINDPIIQASLRGAKSQIKVDTPFNVDRLEAMLHDHPNQPFVKSVMTGLREGFWPLDDGDWDLEVEDLPPKNFVSEIDDLTALRTYRDKEVKAGRWSGPLPTLLPAMKVSPMFVVWQKEKARVITDHSSSGINDGIPKADAKVKYDDMHPFGQALREARAQNPGRSLVTFKDDVASAFLNLPAHPIWQLRQVVIVDTIMQIVRRLVFGNRASPRIWCAVSGLICWIGVRKLYIIGLHVYMDDFFGWDFANNLIWFHGKLRPKRQVQLLLLWNRITCPYDDKKQEHGEVLKIIGFWVDINRGSISLSPDAVTDILDKITQFLATPNRQPPLREWQKLAGHLNWLLNVLPWGRPALSELYRKMSGKTFSYRGIYINARVRDDLAWFSSVIPQSIGVHFIDNGMWPDGEADMVIWTDASLYQGLSFIYSGNGFVYQLKPCPPNFSIDIFYLEMVAIFSAIHHVASFPTPPRKVLLFTDSLDSVSVFNSLGASKPLHNGPLLAVAKIILSSGVDLRVRHIEGKKNIRADLLSRLLLEDFYRSFPAERVRSFAPPRDLLPAPWNRCF